MGAQFLIDSNAVIDLITGELPVAGEAWLEEVIATDQHRLSVITRIELFSKPVSQPEQHTIQLLVDNSFIHGLTEPVVQETIRLRQTYRRKLPDVIIAATALVHGLTLVTRNVADFRAIANLTVLDPHDAASLPTLT